MVERRPLVLIHLLVALLLMALTSFLPATPSSGHHNQNHKQKKKPNQTPPPPPPPAKAPAVSSWEQFKSLLSCRTAAVPSRVHDPSKSNGRLGASCGSSICALRDVVHGTTRVVHRSDTDQNSFSSRSDSGRAAARAVERDTAPFARSAARNGGGHRPAPASLQRGGMQLRRLSGCYECHAVDAESASRRYPRPRTLSSCAQCGEVFTKPESLELHQTLRHAVSELGPEDSGRNIVEIIFKSSWQKRDHPICRIERILKVHNTARTIARFEDYRAGVKARAALLQATATAGAGAAARHNNPKKNPRCAADGNELLRFHCASLACPLGASGSTALCCSPTAPACGVCGVIRHGFPRGAHVRTTASSGRAHDGACAGLGGATRAMLVCRVIAGRVRRAGEDGAGEEGGAYDSVSGEEGPYGNLEELYVASARAILPCFVVIYRVVE